MLSTRIDRAQRHTSQDLNEILYILCVEVNPSFEIHPGLRAARRCGDERTSDSACDGTPKLTDEQLDKLMHLDADLKKRVIGRIMPSTSCPARSRRRASAFATRVGPVGSFLFVGHVGVGKTELAKAIAESMYGSQSRLIRVDCSEYALHEYAKLIGVLPGYIGHNEGGYLTEAAKRRWATSWCFSTRSKKPTRSTTSSCSFFDEGTVTDSKGFKVSFKNAVVLMTSNLGVREVEQSRSTIGFDCEQKKAASFESMKTEINEALKKCFRPEMLNRIDDVIVFNTLGKEDSLKIADIMLLDLAKSPSRRRDRRLRLVGSPPHRRCRLASGMGRARTQAHHQA
jgi:ATP-dependent Clp protease ATP-binding subunit ClpC